MNTHQFPDAVWPERWVERHRRLSKPVMIRAKNGEFSTTSGEILAPSMKNWLRLLGRDNVPATQVPERYEDFRDTEYGVMVFKFYQELLGTHDSLLPGIINSEIRSGWFAARWFDAGRFVYCIDPDTALALMHTRIDDVPVDQLRVPAGTFALKIPADFGWRVRHGLPGVEESDDQPLDGFLVSAELTDDRVTALNVSAVGRSGDPGVDDSYNWYRMSLSPFETLGAAMRGQEWQMEVYNRQATFLAAIEILTKQANELEADQSEIIALRDHLRLHGSPDGFPISENLKAIIAGGEAPTPEEMGQPLANALSSLVDPARVTDTQYINEQFLTLVLGSILYITSTHPSLTRLAKPAAPVIGANANPNKPKHRKAIGRHARLTSGQVVWVGGQHHGIEREKVGRATMDGLKQKPPRPHIRTGHWRGTWVGPMTGERKLETRWIRPTAVGDWDRVLAWEQLRMRRVATADTSGRAH